ncbi:MAG TPA: ABC transporter permease [Nocardioides sp.]|jgi:putative ABC transport system permease protein|nr:ABC transporter permease [Nocardioides sp.]
MRHDLVLGSTRELGTVGLVAGLSGCYAGVLVTTSSFLAASSEHHAAMGAILQVVSTVFILIAVYVAAVVIANAVDTVLAGRVAQIALLRLLGARAQSLRAAVMRGVAVVGALGAVVGAVAGTLVADLLRVSLVHGGHLPVAHYPVTSAWLAFPVVTIAAASAVAGWAGSRGVLKVSPAAAMSGAAVAAPATRRVGRIRAAISLLMIVFGALLLLLAMLLGENGTLGGFLVAFFGSATVSTGLLVGARLVIPGLVGHTSRLLGRTPEARIAGRNAVKDPMRTTRSTMGLVIGVTLVTTFASGLTALRQSVHSWPDLSPAQEAQAESSITTTTQVLVAIVVISSLISAVGFVSTMSLTVIQRRREIGLLRSLGFTRGQVRRMITLESAALSATAIGFGIALGLVFGSVGAQALVGSQTQGFAWGLPWVVLAGTVVGGFALVVAAARPPARRAVRVTPVDALRME